MSDLSAFHRNGRPVLGAAERLQLAAAIIEETAFSVAGKNQSGRVSSLMLLAAEVERIARVLDASADECLEKDDQHQNA